MARDLSALAAQTTCLRCFVSVMGHVLVYENASGIPLHPACFRRGPRVSVAHRNVRSDASLEALNPHSGTTDAHPCSS